MNDDIKDVVLSGDLKFLRSTTTCHSPSFVMVRRERARYVRGDDRADGVGAVLDHRGQVVREIVDPLGIVAPAGGEHVASHALTVERDLVEFQGGGVKRRPPHRLVRRKCLAEVGGGQNFWWPPAIWVHGLLPMASP